MSALTGEDIAEIDYPDEALELQPGDRLIVASDGLDTLSCGAILSFCDDPSSPKECVAALLRGVSDANIPRQDNTTVVIIDVSKKEEVPVPVAAAKPIVAIADAPPQDTQPEAFQDAGESRSLAIIGLIMLLLIGCISGICSTLDILQVSERHAESCSNDRLSHLWSNTGRHFHLRHPLNSAQ